MIRSRIVPWAVGVATIASLLLAGESGAAPSSSSWTYPNGTLTNTRVAESSIDLANISTLTKHWSFDLTGKATASVGGYGTLAANPVVQGGVIYMQDLHSNVYALSLASGHLLWKHLFNKPELSGPGPNGVAVANGLVYGETPTAAFALSETTGHLVWSNASLLKKGQGTFGIQPAVADGEVYLASQYGPAKGGGILLALNATNGHKLWSFATMTGPEPGVTALGLGAGGAWETPLVSGNGTVSFGIGNPYQTIAEAYSQPAKLLYSNSVVTLNARTGKLIWYYQGVPNDFKDYDMQASPISVTVSGTPVVIGGGKMGYVYEMNARTGTLLWKKAVGVHTGYDKQSVNALDHKATLKLPFTFEPGSFGGILTNMAYSNNTIFAATLNLPLAYTKSDQVTGDKPSGTFRYGGAMVALNAATGAIKWNTTIKGIPDGAATVANNLVVTATTEGRLMAFNATSGAIVLNIKLPREVNAPLAIVGNTIIVSAGGPVSKTSNEKSQIDAYTVR